MQLGQHTAFLEVAMLIVGALANVMIGQPDQAKRLLALAQQRNHFLEGRYLDMQLANVEVLLSLEQGQIRQAELLFAQLRARVIPWFSDRSRALALPTITEALVAYNQGRLEGIEERLRWRWPRLTSSIPSISTPRACCVWPMYSACRTIPRKLMPAWC